MNPGSVYPSVRLSVCLSASSSSSSSPSSSSFVHSFYLTLCCSIVLSFYISIYHSVYYSVYHFVNHSIYFNNNNDNNLLHLYSTFLGTQSALHSKGGSPQTPPMCSIHLMMRRQPYCTRTPPTHQLTGGEETVMKPISVWRWLGGHDAQRLMGKHV